jgi:tripartite-type tricarboxylate transporter receptor subunit TctC
MAKANKLEAIEVPFKGAGDLNVALLGGHVDVGMTSVGSIKQFIQTGKLRMLAIHYPKRITKFPEVSTFEEMGYLPGFPYYVCGLFVPKGTPGEAIKKIHDSVKRAMDTPSFKAFAKRISLISIMDLK